MGILFILGLHIPSGDDMPRPRKTGRGVTDIEALLKRKAKESEGMKKYSYNELLKDLRNGRVTVGQALKIHRKLSGENSLYVTNGGVIDVNNLREYVDKITIGLPKDIREEIAKRLLGNVTALRRLVKRLEESGKKPAS